MENNELAKKYLELVGGESNIKSVAHCVTRLRFKLKDETKADDKAIENLEATQGLIKKGGQYQIVLGPGFVDKIYEEVISITNLVTQENETESKNEEGLLNRFLDLIAGIFTPILGIMAASGMIKGFNVLFSVFGLYGMDSNTYMTLEAIGDTFFHFLPVFLGYYAMKKFGGSPMMGATLGAILIYPYFNQLAGTEAMKVLFEGTILQVNVQSTMFGIPFVLPIAGYASSVIPIIVITYVASKVERLAKKITPDTMKLFFVPLLVILISSIIGLLLIGPILSVATSLVSILFKSLLDYSAIVYGTILAGTWQLLVMFGLHWAIIPLGIMEVGEYMAGNVDKMQILVPVVTVSFSQVGVLIAIIVKTRQAQLKKIAMPSLITAVFGITEPALYGIVLKRKKIFVMTCITSAISGGLLMLLGAGSYNMGGLGIFAFPSYLNPAVTSFGEQSDFINVLIASGLNTVLAFIGGYMLFDDKSDLGEEANISIVTPVAGELLAIESIDDKVFSSQTMGETFAVYPEDNNIYSPISGEILAVYPTKHAIGIKSTDGIEILIHIGIDTVELEGQGFEALVEKGQQVNQGDLLVKVDVNLLVSKNYDPTVIMIVLDKKDKSLELCQNVGNTFGQNDEFIKLK